MEIDGRHAARMSREESQGSWWKSLIPQSFGESTPAKPLVSYELAFMFAAAAAVSFMVGFGVMFISADPEQVISPEQLPGWTCTAMVPLSRTSVDLPDRFCGFPSAITGDGHPVIDSARANQAPYYNVPFLQNLGFAINWVREGQWNAFTAGSSSPMSCDSQQSAFSSAHPSWMVKDAFTYEQQRYDTYEDCLADLDAQCARLAGATSIQTATAASDPYCFHRGATTRVCRSSADHWRNKAAGSPTDSGKWFLGTFKFCLDDMPAYSDCPTAFRQTMCSTSLFRFMFAGPICEQFRYNPPYNCKRPAQFTQKVSVAYGLAASLHGACIIVFSVLIRMFARSSK